MKTLLSQEDINQCVPSKTTCVPTSKLKQVGINGSIETYEINVCKYLLVVINYHVS